MYIYIYIYNHRTAHSGSSSGSSSGVPTGLVGGAPARRAQRAADWAGPLEYMGKIPLLGNKKKQKRVAPVAIIMICFVAWAKWLRGQNHGVSMQFRWGFCVWNNFAH